MQARLSIMVVDDEAHQRQFLRSVCERANCEVEEAADGDIAVERCKAKTYDLIFMDLKMERLGGMEALQQINASNPEQRVIIITAFGSVRTAVNSMKYGAMDYLTKPYDEEEIQLLLERVAQEQSAEEGEESADSQKMVRIGVLGRSPLMRKMFEDMELIAPTEATVLIQGESGTGKSMIAQAIHDLSDRHERPFMRVNCGGLTEALLETELFGIERNAAMGEPGRQGTLELAHTGTVFLDEVGDMSPELQVKLLHVLQDRVFTRLGGARSLEVDVRVVAATNRDLYELVKKGAFREDLYYRLNVVNLALPALRERPEDIPVLLDHFLQKSIAKNRKSLKGFSKEALQLLYNYPWPGNVRELENAIERSVILARQERIAPENLPIAIRKVAASEEAPPEELPNFSIRKLERDAIMKVLSMTGGNRTEAAKLLGISRRTLQYKLKEYAIEG